TLVLETGRFAKQAHGAVLVRYEGSVVLVAAVEGSTIPGRDFFPLQVEYRERTYAAGKFPGGFIKRETRPSTKETLTSRLIDRPIVLPTIPQMEQSDLDLIVAGTNDAVCMIEGFAREIPEPEMGDAIVEAHRACRLVIQGIEELRHKAGLGPKELPPQVPDDP